MKRIRHFIIILLIFAFATYTAYAAISALSRNAVDQDSELLHNQKEYINELKETDGKAEINTIPVFVEDDLLFKTNGEFYITRDACFYEDQNACQNNLGAILYAYPTKAIRERDKDTIYLIYDTDTGYRLFLFSSKDNDYLTPEGFPLILRNKMDYSDFKSLNKGDPIEYVEDIDPVAGLVKRDVLEVWGLDSKGYQWYKENGYPPTSIHYLEDGIIKIEYEMKEDRSLVISNIVYNENYDLVSANGKTINYRINELDLPY